MVEMNEEQPNVKADKSQTADTQKTKNQPWFINMILRSKMAKRLAITFIALILVLSFCGYKFAYYPQFAIIPPQKISVKGTVKFKGFPTKNIKARLNNKEETTTDNDGIFLFHKLDPKKENYVEIITDYGTVNML